MTQLDLFSNENQLPANIAEVIAWATKKGDRLIISFKMETPLWVGDLSLVQWLGAIAQITKYGADGSNVAIELALAPDWLIEEMRAHKSPLGGSLHPNNYVEWR